MACGYISSWASNSAGGGSGFVNECPGGAVYSIVDVACVDQQFATRDILSVPCSQTGQYNLLWVQFDVVGGQAVNVACLAAPCYT